MKSREEIIDALKTIQEVCECTRIDGCRVCPLRGANKRCAVTENIPEFWDINDEYIYKKQITKERFYEK